MHSLFYRCRRYHHDPKRPHHHHSDHGDVGIASQPSGGRRIQVVRQVLDANRMMADALRARFAAAGVFVMNVMSSPGSGKTTSLIRTLNALAPAFRCAVIVGDICSTHDADRLAETGAPVVQINTDQFGGECHLAAHVIETALGGMDLADIDLLVIENIGNLVCPAEFDIGEDLRVVVLSVTEGDDKPIKYPLMFRVCDVALVSKTDLVPHLDLTADDMREAIHQVHPDMPVFPISAKTGEGMDAWHQWLSATIVRKQRPGDSATV